MANGSSKPGPAIADAERERREKLQKETRTAIRRYQDSIDLELDDDERPSVEVNVHVPPSDPHPNQSINPYARNAAAISAIVIALAGLAKAIYEFFQ